MTNEIAATLEAHRQRQEELQAELASTQEELASWFKLATEQKAENAELRKQAERMAHLIEVAETLLKRWQPTEAELEAVITIKFHIKDYDSPPVLEASGDNPNDITNEQAIAEIAKALTSIHTFIKVMTENGIEKVIAKEQGEGWKN